MKIHDWERIFRLSSKMLGVGHPCAKESNTWCSWTTFSRLKEDAGYWTSGLPNNDDISESFIKDNGVWIQPFLYEDIAHLIIPKEFCWEVISDIGYENGVKYQNLEKLSIEIHRLKIAHNLSQYCLEFKLF